MTEAEAITLADSKFWETMTMRERAVFQMFESRLCMPFSVFHEAIDEALKGMRTWVSYQKEAAQQTRETYDSLLKLISQ